MKWRIILLATALSASFSGFASKRDNLFNSSCMVEVMAENIDLMPNLPEKCMNFGDDQQVSFVSIPERVLNWGSSGLLGSPWNFRNRECNEFYMGLFLRISLANSHIRLSPHDLYHAHALGFGTDKKHRDGLMLVFHAKEHPRLLNPVVDHYQISKEHFEYNDKEFNYRNFIYNSQGNKLYLVKEKGKCKEFFSDYGLSSLSEEKIMKILPNGTYVGDVNVFGRNVSRLRYNFYSGYSSVQQKTINDLEGEDFGKSVMQRIEENQQFDRWLAELQGAALYFLTGRK